jgi:hypothetical protein
MKSAAILLAVFHISIVAGLAQSGQSPNPPYRGPSCIAGFCLYKTPLPSEEELVAKFGPGTKIGEIRCYGVPQQHAYVHFGGEHHAPGQIVTIFVSHERNCFPSSEKLATSKVPFPALQTKEGIRLGDPYAKLISVYGPPSSKREGPDGLGQIVPHSREREDSPFGETVLVYDGPPDELIQAKFYLHRGKIYAMYISCSE